MSDERDKDGQPQGFKVSDRRKRYEEPSADAPAAAPTEPAPEPPPQAAQPAAEQTAGPADLRPWTRPGPERSQARSRRCPGPGGLPPVDRQALSGRAGLHGSLRRPQDRAVDGQLPDRELAHRHSRGARGEDEGEPDGGRGQAAQGGRRESQGDLRESQRVYQALELFGDSPETAP